MPLRPPPPSPEALTRTGDPLTVKRAAVALARSPDTADHDRLAQFLADTAGLHRLDTPVEYGQSWQDLRLWMVLQALMHNRAPSAHDLLVSLIDLGSFPAHVLRRQLLVRALAAVRPSPPKAIAYWREHGRPGSAIAYDVVDALCENRSPPAMELLARILADTRIDREERMDWMRVLVLPRRNDEPILDCAWSLVSGPLEPELQLALLEVLFDYRPDAWYVGDTRPLAPEPASATVPARQRLYRIGRHGLDHLAPPATLHQTIRTALASLGEQLD